MRKKSLNVRRKVLKQIQFFCNKPKILKIYKEFKKNIPENKTSFIAGISGGPDSMALAFFLKCYSLEKNVKIRYTHIDHCLRKNSSKEASLVKKKLLSIGIKLNIIKWIGKKPQSNIQSIARKNRYKLLLNSTKSTQKKTLFFAHTQNDLIENFFLRIMRGSGLEGITSFNSNLVNNKKYNICRPLLKVKKTDLLDVSNKVFNFFIQDPSNDDIIFKRTRIRHIINQIIDEGFDFTKLQLTLKNLTYSNKTIKYYVGENLKKNVKILNDKRLAILSNNFFEQPQDIMFRSLNIILSELNQKYYNARGKSLTRAINELKNNNLKKLTISGCIIENLQNIVIIYPENQ